MSMSLYLWKTPAITDTDEAARLLDREDESAFEPSPDLTRFLEELLERFPPPGALTADEPADGASPWADGPEGSDRLISLSVRWSARDEDLGEIVALARKYEIVVYGTTGVALTAVGVLLAVVAWKLSIPVLTWVLVFVGGFVAVVAVASLVATAQARWSAD